MDHTGTLFVCATPIGNLGDITLRALEVLRRVDLIAAEDTRVTLHLLNHFGIRKPLVSYHQHSPPRRLEWLLEQLKAGKNVALVCNAGTPGISDPGVPLVQRALKEGIPVVPLPGPSAVTTALSVSGMPAQQFLFLGFPPRSTNKRRTLFAQVSALPFTLVLYEVPHRLRETLRDLLEELGDRQVVLCRELTKIHEEVALTTVKELMRRYESDEPRGEYTLVIAGAVPAESSPDWSVVDQRLTDLLRKGWSIKEAAKEVAKELKVSRSLVYRRALSLKQEKG